MAVGLGGGSKTLQPVLDDYLQGNINLAQLEQQTAVVYEVDLALRELRARV